MLSSFVLFEYDLMRKSSKSDEMRFRFLCVLFSCAWLLKGTLQN